MEAAQPTSGARTAIARLAHEAALDSHEVVGLRGYREAAHTPDGRGGVLDGVRCVAGPRGRYELTLYVAVRPVEMSQLAERIRERVLRAASQQGLGDELGAVDIVVVDVIAEGSST